MIRDPATMTPAQRSDHLFAVISSERFLKMQGLGNEVPFFICPYPPQDADAMGKVGKQLVSKLKQKGIKVLKINLYDLAVEMLKNEGIWEDVLEAERTESRAEFKELLQGVLDPETQLIPAIGRKITAAPFDVLFITGVGEVFPYVRSHNVLNNLQSTAKGFPTVLFFPGQYTHSAEKGTALNLFGILPNDKYYRAFNIFTVRP